MGRSRFAKIARARQILAYACREWIGWSYPQIGREMGLDHTTCMYAHRRVAERSDETIHWIRRAWDPAFTAEENEMRTEPLHVASDLDLARAEIQGLKERLLETVKDRDDLSDRLEMALAKRRPGKCLSCGG